MIFSFLGRLLFVFLGGSSSFIWAATKKQDSSPEVQKVQENQNKSAYSSSLNNSDFDFSIIIASDPQLYWECVSEECQKQASGEKKQGELSNRWQSTAIQKQAEELAPQFAGIFVNGDLTAFGHEEELSAYKTFFRNNLSGFVFEGLGNHDYQNNIHDCYDDGCANRMVLYLKEMIENLRKNKTLLNFSSDYTESKNYYKFPSIRKKYEGSFSYSFDLEGVHFVQLNNFPWYTTEFDHWNVSKARRDHFHVLNSMNWLKNDLEASKKRGVSQFVLNIHDLGDSALKNKSEYENFKNLVREYNIEVIFCGHLHDQRGHIMTLEGAPIFQSGSSSDHTYLVAYFKGKKLIHVDVQYSVPEGQALFRALKKYRVRDRVVEKISIDSEGY